MCLIMWKVGPLLRPIIKKTTLGRILFYWYTLVFPKKAAWPIF